MACVWAGPNFLTEIFSLRERFSLYTYEYGLGNISTVKQNSRRMHGKYFNFASFWPHRFLRNCPEIHGESYLGTESTSHQLSVCVIRLFSMLILRFHICTQL